MRKILLLIGLLIALGATAFAQFNIGNAPTAWKYNYISTQTTTLVKYGPGTLHNITMEGGSSGTVIIYDGANGSAGSAPIIGSFDSTSALFTYTYDVTFSSSCSIVTGAATKLTVSFL